MFGSSASGSRFPRVVIFVPLLALLLSACGINSIPTFEERAKAKWSDVQNQYQRRADLIPNLVETVKGFAKQERTVLEAVTNARARARHRYKSMLISSLTRKPSRNSRRHSRNCPVRWVA